MEILVHILQRLSDNKGAQAGVCWFVLFFGILLGSAFCVPVRFQKSQVLFVIIVVVAAAAATSISYAVFSSR
jgi:CHASE2 domain-containing sensor protein